jgi:hypothetical protein
MRSLRALILLSLCVSGAFAAGCLENKDFYQNLPTAIGREDQVGKFPFAFNCDTVFVRKGVTTVVYPGTLLYFSHPSINSVIKVEGTLVLKGSQNSYVSLSGSLDSSRNGVAPGQKLWGGIEVAEGGRLEMEYVGCMRAPTPVTAFSQHVKIVNCWFKGSSGMILPDGSLYPMESSWHAINDLDLTKGATDRKASARPPESLSEGEKADLRNRDKGFWTWKRAGVGVAALAVVGVGAVFLFPNDPPEPHHPVTTPPTGKRSIGIDTLQLPN